MWKPVCSWHVGLQGILHTTIEALTKDVTVWMVGSSVVVWDGEERTKACPQRGFELRSPVAGDGRRASGSIPDKGQLCSLRRWRRRAECVRWTFPLWQCKGVEDTKEPIFFANKNSGIPTAWQLWHQNDEYCAERERRLLFWNGGEQEKKTSGHITHDFSCANFFETTDEGMQWKQASLNKQARALSKRHLQEMEGP